MKGDHDRGGIRHVCKPTPQGRVGQPGSIRVTHRHHRGGYDEAHRGSHTPLGFGCDILRDAVLFDVEFLGNRRDEAGVPSRAGPIVGAPDGEQVATGDVAKEVRIFAIPLADLGRDGVSKLDARQ